jgi:hypothetical protein
LMVLLKCGNSRTLSSLIVYSLVDIIPMIEIHLLTILFW